MLEEKFREHLETQIDQLLPSISIAGSDSEADKQKWKYGNYFDFSYGFGVGMMLGAIIVMFETYYKRPAKSDEIQDAVELIENRAVKIRKDLQDRRTG